MAKINISMRDMSVFHKSVSSIDHVALIPEVQESLVRWIKHTTKAERGVLIGGLAMSFYAKPRTTEDIDLLFLQKSDIPENVFGFKKHRVGAFQNNATHVEVEVVSPDTVNLPNAVAAKVYKTAKDVSGVRVASLDALIVLKLFGADNIKRKHKDIGDIARLIEDNPKHEFDFSFWDLSEKHLAILKEVQDSLA